MFDEAKPKKCKVCGDPFTPHMTTDRFCSSQCAVAHSKSRKTHNNTFFAAKRHREPTKRTRAKERAKALDNRLCRLAGDGHECDKLCEAHHIIYLSESGVDEVWNLITLCGVAHKAAHRSKLKYQVELLKIRGGEDWFDAIDKTGLPDSVRLKLNYLLAISDNPSDDAFTVL